jgi:hypothetical protein
MYAIVRLRTKAKEFVCMHRADSFDLSVVLFPHTFIRRATVDMHVEYGNEK